MKKFQTAILALFAVLAFGTVFASSASAETTLAAEWLHSGAPITTSLAGEVSGNVLFEDTKAKVALLCSFKFRVTFSSGGKKVTVEISNLGNEKIELGLRGLSIAKGDCVNVSGCGAPAEVWPEGLPWKGQLFLKENGTFAEAIAGSGTGGTFGYDSLCTVLIDVEDECLSTIGTLPVENDLEDAASPAAAMLSPDVKCSVGGAESGLNELDELTFFSLTNGELLTVSE